MFSGERAPQSEPPTPAQKEAQLLPDPSAPDTFKEERAEPEKKNPPEEKTDSKREQKSEFAPQNPQGGTISRSEKRKTSLGRFRLTFYCGCVRCNGKWAGGPTASGTTPQQGRTIAVDPSVIPLGSRVYIEGFGTYIAEDTGSAIKGNRIDVYRDDHEECYALGVQYREVYIY